METSITATARFDASHTIPDLERCSKLHGHSYTVHVTSTGDPDPKTGWPRGTDDLPKTLEDLTFELNRRNLADMLPGVVTSPMGIAAAFAERLVMHFPRITTVKVECSDGTMGRVKRTPRVL